MIPARPSSNQHPWHALEPATVLAMLSTSERDGLAPDEVSKRVARYGENELPRGKRTSVATLLWHQINSPIVFVLFGSALLALVLGKAVDSAVVLGAVVVGITIGFVQELRAGRSIEALSDMVPFETRVIRAGGQTSVRATQLVPGDVVLLASGDRVPADVRILAVRNLRVEEAALTGESIPVEKVITRAPQDAAVGDRTSMAFGGTLVTSGTATSVVVSTGGDTELGRISQLLQEVTELQTPLTRAIAAVGTGLTMAVLGVSVSLLVVCLVRGYRLVDGALVAITLAVASIPEGLPAIITIALAIGVQRMAARHAIIRFLPSVETLGSTTVICSDKTGTLTRNEMTVRSLATLTAHCEVSGVGYAPIGILTADGTTEVPSEVHALVQAAALCSDASVHLDGDGWIVSGDPTEAALVVVAMKAGLEIEALRRAWPRIDVIPFESEHQFMATLHDGPEGVRVLLIKGASEAVLHRAELTAIEHALAVEVVAGLARRGMRVLAVGRKLVAPSITSLTSSAVDQGFELLGFEGMMDPPRPEAIAAITRCHNAGITVKMITGDHVDTATAIGRQLGLLAADQSGFSGRHLATLDDDELSQAAVNSNVFARVTPEHKLRLVQALQRRGHVVAMTGDGVNDAPALRQANVGVAMGITGTAVAKEAADVVLADDNFATIASAVEEGRRIYDNLIKSLAFVLPTSLGLGLVLVVAVIAFPLIEIGGELIPLMPMRPTQILWINLVASVTLSLPLAFEVLEPDAMRRPPRRAGAPILDRFLILRTILVAVLMCAGAVGLFAWEYWTEVPRVGHVIALREAQTMAVTTVVMFQVFYLLNCRSVHASARHLGVFSNPTVFVGIGTIILLQAAFIYLPWGQSIFGTATLKPEAIGFAILVAAVILPAMGIEKAIWRLRARQASPVAGPTISCEAPKS